MATRRIVPEGAPTAERVAFRDGTREVPEWQMAFTKPEVVEKVLTDQHQPVRPVEELTYQEWLDEVFQPAQVALRLGDAVRGQLSTHFRSIR